jgi:hypothetical protein
MFIDFPKSNFSMPGLEEVTIPEMVTIRQHYDPQKIEDVLGELRKEMDKLPHKESYRGKRICLTVGSRGIPGLDGIVRTMGDVLKSWGAKPFIIPSMGSHGGGVAEGQLEMLAGYNITEESMDMPILSSMEVVQYAEYEGIPLYCDKYAFESDGIVIFNKIKPHTDFRGKHESGLAKMIAIGIAKHKGAMMFHSFGFERFAELLAPISEIFVKKCPVAFGVGVVQNAYDDICNIEVCTPEKILETDARLLQVAKERMAKFKFDNIDLLIIDEIGKNISGNGHDSNVTGRNMGNTFHDIPNLKRLFIRGITPESHHNGNGIGKADVTLRRVLRDIDWDISWTNVVTTGVLIAGAIPMYVETDEEAIRLCLLSCPNLDSSKARVVRIKNTIEMGEIQVSVPLYESIKDYKDISYVSGPAPMVFDQNGDLAD